jgi:uncharacterized RDD family membrane protein YckC
MHGSVDKLRAEILVCGVRVDKLRAEILVCGVQWLVALKLLTRLYLEDGIQDSAR